MRLKSSISPPRQREGSAQPGEGLESRTSIPPNASFADRLRKRRRLTITALPKELNQPLRGPPPWLATLARPPQLRWGRSLLEENGITSEMWLVPMASMTRRSKPRATPEHEGSPWAMAAIMSGAPGNADSDWLSRSKLFFWSRNCSSVGIAEFKIAVTKFNASM